MPKLSVRSPLQGSLVTELLRCGLLPPPAKIRLLIQSFCPVFLVHSQGQKGRRCWRSHEGVLCRRPVREAREGSSCFLDAACHSLGVSAQGGGHGQVGELGVEMSEVCGSGL